MFIYVGVVCCCCCFCRAFVYLFAHCFICLSAGVFFPLTEFSLMNCYHQDKSNKLNWISHRKWWILLTVGLFFANLALYLVSNVISSCETMSKSFIYISIRIIVLCIFHCGTVLLQSCDEVKLVSLFFRFKLVVSGSSSLAYTHSFRFEYTHTSLFFFFFFLSPVYAYDVTLSCTAIGFVSIYARVYIAEVCLNHNQIVFD